MNSKAAQLTENGTEIVRLFARFALGASFLSAVADRFGLWGPYGAKNVSWGDFAHFVEYTGAVTSLFPSSSTVSFAWAATVAETLFGILLIAGFKIRMASVLSGLLLLSFAIGMVTGLGIKTPFDYSVFSAAAAAFLLAFWEPDRFTLDKLLNRLRN
jgi:DoxX.